MLLPLHCSWLGASGGRGQTRLAVGRRSAVSVSVCVVSDSSAVQETSFADESAPSNVARWTWLQLSMSSTVCLTPLESASGRIGGR